MAKILAVKGTDDLLPNVMRLHNDIIKTAKQVTTCYGFDEIATPIFEYSQVFSRTLGETSDVVSKEMYRFQSRGGDDLTLRPEGTAGIVRAVIANGLTQSLPLKYFYHGPMFRYERPQKGRRRQFHQLGVEWIGNAHPKSDAEVIICAADLLKKLNLESATYLEINTLGDKESRKTYRDALVVYLDQHRTGLSKDSQARLDRNPLRILDSKSEQDQEILKKAPIFDAYLNQSSKEFYQALCENLDRLNIAYRHNPLLVRGLDYYSHTVFEFKTDKLGAQGTVLAGGRYDGLMALMGGQETPAVGWAAGFERLCGLIEAKNCVPMTVALVALGDEASRLGDNLAHTLRLAHIRVDRLFEGNLKKHMRHAHRIQATYTILIGDDEIVTQKAIVRNMKAGEQEEVPFESLMAYFKKNNVS